MSSSSRQAKSGGGFYFSKNIEEGRVLACRANNGRGEWRNFDELIDTSEHESHGLRAKDGAALVTSDTASTVGSPAGPLGIGSSGVAGGKSSTATGSQSLSMGFGSTANASNSAAVGRSAQATSASASSFGYDAQGVSTAVGAGSRATGEPSSAVGYQTFATGDFSAAVGTGANASAEGAVAVAHGVQATAENACGAGRLSEASGVRATSFGYVASALKADSFAAGSGPTVNAVGAIGLGANANIDAVSADSIVVGPSNTPIGSSISSIVWGQAITVDSSEGAISVGNTVEIDAVEGALALGRNTEIVGGTVLEGSIALGQGADVTDNQAAFAIEGNQVVAPVGSDLATNFYWTVRLNGTLYRIKMFFSSIVTDQLALYYRADNVDGVGTPGNGSTTTLVNLVGGGYNGTIDSTSKVIQDGTKIGTPWEYGVKLDDAADKVDTGAFFVTNRAGVNTLSSLSCTWEFWLKYDNAYSSGFGYLWSEAAIGDGTNTRNSFAFANSSFSSYFASTPRQEFTSGLWSPGEYMQFTAVYQSNNISYYKNGGFVIQVPITNVIYAGVAPNTSYIGNKVTQPLAANAQFSIVRIYDKPLSADEVLQNYNAEIS